MTLNDRRAFCKKISIELAKQGDILNRKTINNNLLEQGNKAYSPRKKPWLTETMEPARYERDDKVQTVRQRSE